MSNQVRNLTANPADLSTTETILTTDILIAIAETSPSVDAKVILNGPSDILKTITKII